MKGLFRVKVPYSPQRSEGGGSGLRGQRQTEVCFQDGVAKLLDLQAPACSLASSTRCFRKEMVHSVFIQNIRVWDTAKREGVRHGAAWEQGTLGRRLGRGRLEKKWVKCLHLIP